jgi:hypothetical protein
MGLDSDGMFFSIDQDHNGIILDEFHGSDRSVHPSPIRVIVEEHDSRSFLERE